MSYTKSIKRLEQLGLEAFLSKSIHATIKRWVDSCGEEWTVKRLKDIRTYYLNFRNGNQSVPPFLAVHSDGTVKGAFRPLFYRKVSRRIWSVLRIYTAFVSPTVTVNQSKKFISSVKAEPVPMSFIAHFKEVASYLDNLLEEEVIQGYKSYTFSNNRFAPNRFLKSVPEDATSILEDANSSCVDSYILDDAFTDLFADAYDDLFLRVRLRKGEFFKNDPVDSPYVGKISVIQEPGYKARFIANPRRIFQVVLLPLGKQLFSLLRKLPWDCTFEQESGPLWAQTQLIAGKTCHSVDLSDASNNIPLILQTKLFSWCKKINQTRLRLFEKISTDDWYLPKALDLTSSTSTDEKGTSIRWSKGQPLGLYPSFPSFAILHGALVRSIEIGLSVSDTFRILGDDIVISDDEVYHQYMELLDRFQIPVSHDKCIDSKKFAEFAGSLITKTEIIDTQKWRPITQDNKLSVFSMLPRSLDLSIPEEYFSWMIRALPKPVGCGNVKGECSLEHTAKIVAPLLVHKRDHNDNDKVLVRRTHDYVFRSSKLYDDVFTDPVLTKTSDLLDILGDLAYTKEKFQTLSSYLRCMKAGEVPRHIKGLELYKNLHERFDFSFSKVPPIFERYLYMFESEDIIISFPELCRDDIRKSKTLFNLFKEKVAYGQYTILKMSPLMLKQTIEDTMWTIYTESWKTFFRPDAKRNAVRPIYELI